MSVNGVNGVNNPNESSWKVGLVNYAHKYLTAETFGHKINVTGTTLKKRQTFTLVQDLVEEGVVYIRSHLGCYVSTDRMGNVSCDSEEPGTNEKFVVEYDKEFSGRWSFRHVVHGNYLGGSDDNLKCFAMSVSNTELWTVQLSIHPQVHMRNVNRKRYAHLNDDQLQVTQTIPWAAKSLIFLVFKEGQYSMKTLDGKYLLANGELSSELTDDAKFTLEIRSGQNRGLAFRDRNGCYLSGVGSTATMKTRNKTVSKDELFTLEDTHPQVVLQAKNGKKVSIKQGVDVSANQGEEEGDNEIFQMEYQPGSQKWAFRTVHNKYWQVEAGSGGIQAVGNEIRTESLFDVEWQDDGSSVTLKAFNDTFVHNKATGSMLIGGEAANENTKFKVKIVNRPMLVLKSDHGFVACSPNSADISCNRSQFEVIGVEDVPDEHGVYYFKTASGKYWSVADGGAVMADGSDRSKFQLQVRDNRKLTIRALCNQCFIKGEQNGLFKAVGQQVESSTLFEY